MWKKILSGLGISVLAGGFTLSLIYTSKNSMVPIKPAVEDIRALEELAVPEEVDPLVDHFISDPNKVFHEERAFLRDRGIRMGILSLVGEGLVNIAVDEHENTAYAKKGLETIIDTAMRFSPYQQPVTRTRDFGNEGIYLIHLNILLGSYKRLTGEDTYAGLNERISKYLASRIVSDPHHHMRSYTFISGKSPTILKGKWPSDQTTALYSIWLYDKNFGTTITDEPARQWLEYMHKHGTDPKTGLFVSEVTGYADYAKYPRGCALSWAVMYMSYFAPEEAEKLWKKYKRYFKVDLIMGAGFREYPFGVDRKPDFDSGPIVMGIGVTATAFAIGASKAVGDYPTYAQLKITESAGTLAANADAQLEKTTNSIVAKATQFHNDTITRWY